MSFNYPTVVYLNREDFPRLIEAELPWRTQIAVRLGAKCGLRPIEIRHVTPRDLDPGSRQLRVHYCGRSKPRAVPIDTETIDLIEDMDHVGSGDMPILRAQRGYEMRSGPVLSVQLLCLIVKDAARKAGIASWRRFYPYLLRHYYAADWVQKGGNICTLQRFLGHRYLTTTTIYLRRLVWWADDLREYDRIKGGTRKMEETNWYSKWCHNCDHELVCMFKDIADRIVPMDQACRQFKRREPKHEGSNPH